MAAAKYSGKMVICWPVTATIIFPNPIRRKRKQSWKWGKRQSSMLNLLTWIHMAICHKKKILANMSYVPVDKDSCIPQASRLPKYQAGSSPNGLDVTKMPASRAGSAPSPFCPIPQLLHAAPCTLSGLLYPNANLRLFFGRPEDTVSSARIQGKETLGGP